MAGIGAGMGMANIMLNQMNQNQQQNQQQNQPPAKESKEEIMKTLKDLADLKTAGVITEEEFEAMKKKGFPIQISEVRQAKDPMTAVAEGLLVLAMQE